MISSGVRLEIIIALESPTLAHITLLSNTAHVQQVAPDVLAFEPRESLVSKIDSQRSSFITFDETQKFW